METKPTANRARKLRELFNHVYDVGRYNGWVRGPITKPGGFDESPGQEADWSFYFGFYVGQAEKVYLGACRAAMFRPPSAALYRKAYPILQTVADLYELSFYPHASMQEIWLLRDQTAVEVLEAVLTRSTPDSPIWHETRGRLCGVPMEEIDREYHTR